MPQRFLIPLICWMPTACVSLDQVPTAPEDALARAAALIEAKDYDQAVTTLEYFGATPLSTEDKANWYLLAGTAMHRAGDSWDAFDLYRDFIRTHRFPAKIPALADLTYEIGESLAASDKGFWPFYSERLEAKTVLREFVTLYSTRPQMPDALHRLAELAYEDEEYELARERYTQLITGRYGRSVWNTKAAFRVAMCYFRRLEGPDYDLEGMERAMAELTDFLKTDVENPTFREQASVALRTVRSWLAEKQLSIAGFYRTLGNAQGERRHLERTVREFAETPAAKQAARRLLLLGDAGRPTAGDSARRSGGGT